MKRDEFPAGFLFGTATASCQIEGGAAAEGKGESIWDRFAREPGVIADGSSPATACDHHRLWREDVALMRRMGVPAYRLSVAWPRVIPGGSGAVNEAGLDFYRRLVDELLGAGITPAITLYHWDLPQALQDRGGWTNPDIASWFRDYARVMFDALGDRVPYWITLNEPWCTAVLGHQQGTHAPGLRDLHAMLACAKNQLLAHGHAVREFRERARPGKIGITLNMAAHAPASDAPADVLAAERAHALDNLMFADPLYLGRWPDVLTLAFDHPAEWQTSELEWDIIRSPTDFLGFNYYTRSTVRDDPAASPPRTANVDAPDRPRTAMGWEIYPEGMRELLVMITRRYGRPPILVTESGAAFDDVADESGFVDDADRVRYFQAHLAEALRAIAEGVDLRGYFLWSLLDNFEWAEGYVKRFGIVRVDYATQRRIPKASAAWFARFLAGDEAFTIPECGTEPLPR